MAEAFLDPSKPITTCSAKTCSDCPVSTEVHCHFHARDLRTFLLIMLPVFFIGGTGIWLVSPWWLAPWLLAMVSYFGFAEIRVMCSHCPHYAEPGKGLQCWANYGSPRLWKYRPGPMSRGETIVFLAGLSIVLGYPIVFLALAARWLLLAAYLLTAIGWYASLRRSYCSECMNFACPLNIVRDDIRIEFFKRNPDVAHAWEKIRDEASAG